MAISMTTVAPHMNHSVFRLNRRSFLGRYAGALGTLALAHLLDQEKSRVLGAAELGEPGATREESTGAPKARAKSVICLFQHGGPSQMDLFDPKPVLTEQH